MQERAGVDSRGFRAAIAACCLGAAGWLLPALAAHAQEPEPVAFDRPGIAFGTGVLAPGALAWEQGLPDFSSDREDGQRSTAYAANSRLRLGLGASLELQLATDIQVWQRGPDGHAQGGGDSSVSLKLALPAAGDSFSWALMASGGIATGDPAVADRDDYRQLGVTFAWELAGGRGATLYLDHRDGRDGNSWTLSPGYTVYAGERLGAYVEAGFSHGAGDERVAGGGLAWTPKPGLQLDASVLRGLGGDSTDWQGGMGISFALR